MARSYRRTALPPLVGTHAAAHDCIEPSALGETFTGLATWRSLPSWALVPTADFSTPTEALRFMAHRAGSTVRELDSSHAAPVAHPVETSELIVAAASSIS
ncbi:MAG: hypothetical protein ACR2KJ_16725 [Jatrophihabitans sp.]